MIVAVPADIPLTSPVEPMVAMAGLLLLHVPPGVVLVSIVVAPAQTDELPIIGATDVVTVSNVCT